MGFLSALFFVVGLAAAYWLIVRPLLRTRPVFQEFYNRTDSFWAALRMKLSTIKTKLSAGLLLAASTLIELHDFILPSATGIDWTPITSQVPPWVWPIASMGVAGLFWYLRKITAEHTDRVVAAVEAGVTPADATIIAESTSTPHEAAQVAAADADAGK